LKRDGFLMPANYRGAKRRPLSTEYPSSRAPLTPRRFRGLHSASQSASTPHRLFDEVRNIPAFGVPGFEACGVCQGLCAWPEPRLGPLYGNAVFLPLRPAITEIHQLADPLLPPTEIEIPDRTFQLVFQSDLRYACRYGTAYFEPRPERVSPIPSEPA
jgi:hypothetical protein